MKQFDFDRKLKEIFFVILGDQRFLCDGVNHEGSYTRELDKGDLFIELQKEIEKLIKKHYLPKSKIKEVVEGMKLTKDSYPINPMLGSGMNEDLVATHNQALSNLLSSLGLEK